MTTVTVVGSGVAGLCCAYYLLQAKYQVDIITASDGPDQQCCSWWAGGMLAPFCEQESAEPLIETLGHESMSFWQSFASKQQIEYHANGSLVVTAPRDRSLLRQFSEQTQGAQAVGSDAISQLEPDLAHFKNALWFEHEAHLEPRIFTQALWRSCQELGASIETSRRVSEAQFKDLQTNSDWLVDCRGLAASDVLNDLRGVKGEMLHLYCPDVSLQRPVRFLHPRHPIYLVPRPNNIFMLGATMLEVNASKRATVRSVLELLSAAYAIHPAFAEAEILEIGVDARPAFDDNLPKVRVDANRLYVNGLYRHGFLAAPAIARRVTDYIDSGLRCNEVFDANYS
ncbi:MAG: glycine oxidase ThiO [Arenicella sp.]|nr:glycine oxidase ThiO [Arenicella sp.]